MRFGSLFSGIGGFDLGFEQAGLRCEWQVELDKDCNRVLANRFPDVSRYADVKDVGKLPTVDVICGGFPCQDLSVAGKRKGLAGERSGLWFEFLRIIESNLPRWIVIENVPGLLSSDEGRDFAAILRGLVECGYRLAWRIVDAQYDGVAQRRRRVFIVGSLGDGSCAEILFESESVSWNPPTRREAGSGVASAVTTGTGKSSGPRNENGEPINMVIPIQEVGAREGERQNGAGIGIGKDGNVMYTLQSGQVHGVAHALRSEGADASEDGTGRGTPLVVANCFNGYTGGPDDNDAQGNHLIAFGWNKSDSQTMRADSDTTDALQSSPQSNPAIAFTERTRSEGRTFEAQEELAYSVANNAGGGSTHGSRVAGGFGVRRLTPTECERLQGFPDFWSAVDATGKQISDSARYRMLGNAVVVPVAKWIGTRIGMSFDQQP